jgi:starch synthase
VSRLRVLQVASEAFPLVKTGGLADVAGALPHALAGEDVRVTTLLPGYPAVLAALADAGGAYPLEDMFGGPARLISATVAGLDLLVLDAPHLFDRAGHLYTDAGGTDWPDNAERFAALARAGAMVAAGEITGITPDVVHAHDWQAGLLPAYLALGGGQGPPSVFTIHNLAFQGQFPAALLDRLGLAASSYTIDGVEHYGAIGFLKAGVRFADRLTTVSPTYAAEITTEEGGMGLAGLLRGRADVLSGILNGIDTSVWNPASDPALASPFGTGDLASREPNKAALQQRLGMAPAREALLFGVVSRLSWQKGCDLLLEAVPAIVASGGQLALLGSGDRSLEAAFSDAAAAHPGSVACVTGYDEALAHQIQAGCDALLVPSRFEPCGLTQLCALRYGAVPVVSRVGGLADTVIDASPMALAAGAATGVQFAPVTSGALEHAIRRSFALYRTPERWRSLQAAGMATDVSWAAPARAYADLYRSLASRH